MKSILKKILKWTSFPSLVLLLAFMILNGFIKKNFWSVDFFNGFFASNCALICVAIGMCAVISVGAIDISLGTMVGLINVIFIQLLLAGFSVSAVIILCILASLAIGAFNGFLVAILRVAPMLATFATSAVLSGLALWIMPMPGGSVPSYLNKAFNSVVWGIPVSLILILVVILLSKILTSTRFGLWQLATGKDEMKSFMSGISTHWVKFIAYVFAALCAGIGGIAMTVYIGGGDSRIGLMFSMNSIAACVIGGIDLAGGVGDVWGPIFGAMFLSMVTTVIFAANFPSLQQSFFQGLILVVCIMGAAFLSQMGKRKKGVG